MKKIHVFLMVFILFGLSGCYGVNSASPVQQQAQSTGSTINVDYDSNPITIDSAGTIPLWENTPTTTLIYIHNHGNNDIGNLVYSISDSTPHVDGSRSTFVGDSCRYIAAHSKCALYFTTPSLVGQVIEASALLKVSYLVNAEEHVVNRFLKYQVIMNHGQNGIFPGSAIRLNTNKDSYSDGNGMVYLYAIGQESAYQVIGYDTIGINADIQNEDVFDREFQNHEIRAAEVSVAEDTKQTGSLKIISRSISGKVSSASVSIMAAPLSSAGPILVAGTSSVVNVSLTNLGSFIVLNAGNASAKLGTIVASTPPDANATIYITTGVNPCTTGASLAPNASCNVYYSVGQVGSNSDISISYTNSSGSMPQTLIRNVIWYNPIGGALISMLASPSSLLLTYSASDRSSAITMQNTGGYDLQNMQIESAFTVSGSAVVTVSTPLSCTSGTSLPAFSASTCTYGISVADSEVESYKYIKLKVKGTYSTNMGSQTYNRSILVDYTTEAQQGLFTWMKGLTGVNQAGVYGTIGVEASGNFPSSRAGIATWKSIGDNYLWLFGGNGSSGTSLRNDLWRYNRSTNQWAWMKGSSSTNQRGTYGTKGIAATANTPGARYLSFSWVDQSSGNFWLLGGYGYPATGTNGLLNDLWRYNPTTNQWTWMNGSNTRNNNPTYGTQSVEAVNNTPGGVSSGNTWMDSSGNLWLFTGYGCIPNPSGSVCQQRYMSQVWRYNVTTNRWAWMDGSQSANINGIYGTKGVASASNIPGGRSDASSWSDVAGNLWLFGGNGYGASSNGYLNDFWKYNITTGQWTWMSGSQGVNALGVYPAKGIPGPESLSMPGARFAAQAWVDNNGNFWLFGGFGYSSAGSAGYLNDLWEYNPNTNKWAWIGGSGNSVNALNVYGAMTVESSTNVISGRYDSGGWSVESGSFWLFGGFGYSSTTAGLLGDLWRIRIKQ